MSIWLKSSIPGNWFFFRPFGGKNFSAISLGEIVIVRYGSLSPGTKVFLAHWTNCLNIRTVSFVLINVSENARNLIVNGEKINIVSA